MPISKIKGGAINDDAISTAKIQDDAVTDPKIVDSYTTSLQTNPEFSGTEAARMPVGTTAERANAQTGDIRFNSTLSLMEYYDGTIWKAIDSPPVVSSISPTSESDASANITITGSNFQSGATVQFIGDDGTVYNSPSVTVNSSTEVVATTPSTPLSVANEPYDIKLTNTSGLSGTLADALDAGGVPSWDTAAGTILTIYDGSRSSLSVTISATDPDGDAVSYALASGDSLPSGLSLNASTGAITGSTSAVGSDTTTTFDIEASTASNDTVSRTFNIVQKAPIVTSYTSTGSGSFSVPSGVTAVDVLVVAGGAAGGQGGGDEAGGGGGAGGLIYRPAFPVTPGGSISYTVGGGSSGVPSASHPGADSQNGQDSVFGTLTAKGGGGAYGAGDRPDAPSYANGYGYPGGSGGGARAGSYSRLGGQGIQPQQPGDSGTYGFGNPGGTAWHASGAHPSGQAPANPFSSNPGQGGSGGGGAGGAGSSNGPGQGGADGGAGGAGKSYSISGSSVAYAGGGGGSGHENQSGNGGPASSGGGAGAQSHAQAPGANGGSATANRGGGGGATGGQSAQGTSGAGGSGIVIVKY